MPLMPKRVKFRKPHRPKVNDKATKGNYVSFGDYGLQALGAGLVSAKQIEAGRISARHFMGKEGKLWIRIFPHHAITSKPLETRQGGGKGEPSYWAAVVREGTILYEVGGVTEEQAKQILGRIAYKMPLRVRMVGRRHKL